MVMLMWREAFSQFGCWLLIDLLLAEGHAIINPIRTKIDLKKYKKISEKQP